MYVYIGSIYDYNDKLDQADYAFESGKWRTAYGYYNACCVYAREHGMDTSYLEMKMDDCRANF